MPIGSGGLCTPIFHGVMACSALRFITDNKAGVTWPWSNSWSLWVLKIKFQQKISIKSIVKWTPTSCCKIACLFENGKFYHGMHLIIVFTWLMSDYIPKLDLVLAKQFDPKHECVICGKRGIISDLISKEHGRRKVKQVTLDSTNDWSIDILIVKSFVGFWMATCIIHIDKYNR